MVCHVVAREARKRRAERLGRQLDGWMDEGMDGRIDRHLLTGIDG